MLVGPDWLFLECHGSRSNSSAARIIYRAFIKLAKHTGHVIDLDCKRTRREVMWGIKNHRIQMCTVPCVRCDTVAWLPDWVACSQMTPEMRDAVIRDNPDRFEAGLLDFLLRCPGGGYKQVTNQRTQPPEVL